MGVFYYGVTVALLFLLLLYVFLELHYFMRLALCAILARLCKKKIHILQETEINGICLTTDIDTLITHMNNARFLRELDFARVDFYERTGLYRCIRSKKGGIAMGGTTIRYRRFIKLFHRYTITSKIIYWDDQSIYMEHRFITPTDQFVNAIVMTRTRLVNCSTEEVMREMLAMNLTDIEKQATPTKPAPPPELEKWLECNAISSANLRTEC